MYQPLHHKYRPQTFAQLAGQEAIAQTLTNAITSQKIVPAYLFCGHRGTGKTSSARILAKSLNCQESDRPTPNPCGVCETCRSITNGSALDVIEIDAASNTGVDNIREIIEKAQFAPVNCRYKVYVIDECHMLSTAAFNALLKTLEEPSPRVVFVLATTDPQRVLPTIISRCQRFDYRRIGIEAMVTHLQEIAIKEEIDIDTEAISLVGQLANGGMRDAQTLLDQLSLLSGTITPEKVWDLVGAVSEQDLLALIQAIASNSPEVVITQCRKLLDRGREPLIVLQNLANFYLNLLIAKTAPDKQDLVAITNDTWQQLCTEAKKWQLNDILEGQKKLKDSEVQIKNTSQPRLWLEITFLTLLPSANNTVVTTNTQPLATITAINNTNSTAKTSITTSTARKNTDNNHRQQQQQVAPSAVGNNNNTRSTVPPSNSQPVENIAQQQQTEKQPQDTVTKTTSINYSSFEEVKEKVAQVIEKQMTKALFMQKCHIVKIEGFNVVIGFVTEALLNMAKGSKGDIEAGFKQVYGQSVTVSLCTNKELKNSTSTTNTTTGNSHQVNSAHKQQQPSSNQTNSANQLQSPLSNQNVSSAIQTNTQPVVNTTPLSVDNQKSIDISASTPQNNNQSLATEVIPSSVEVEKAAEVITKNFNGEIVLTETKTIEMKTQTPSNSLKITNRPDIDSTNEDDIPF